MSAQCHLSSAADPWATCRAFAKCEYLTAPPFRAGAGMEIRSGSYPSACWMPTVCDSSFSKQTLTGVRHARISTKRYCHDPAETQFQKGYEPFPLSSNERAQVDVVIVGAGIIGLSIAHRLLLTTSLSIALVDAFQPCAGATGAGQGYIWLGHRSPDTIVWNLAKRSKQLWEEFALRLQKMGSDPLSMLGFKKTGSLLFGTSVQHALALHDRAKALCKGGIQVEFLESSSLREVEPQLDVGAKGSAILTPNDCQIDAQLAVSYMLAETQKYSSSGRFQKYFCEPAVKFLWDGQVKGVQTSRREIRCNKKLVIAAGAWSGQLMQNIFDRISLPHVLAVKPRKGHLLVLEGLPQINLRHGLMEYAYKELEESSRHIGVASTATMDAKGRVLLGSSRQFVGFDYNLQYDVMESIFKKAADYLPALSNICLEEALKNGNARVGHRPYFPDGRPIIGEVEGLEGLLLATGHEGEGLSLALGTAEMVSNLILEEMEPVIDPSPFSPTGRLVQ